MNYNYFLLPIIMQRIAADLQIQELLEQVNIGRTGW